MVGDLIRAQLRRPLEGDRRFVSEQRGQFLVRVNPEHLADVLAERHRRRVQEDIANFRRSLNRDRNLGALQDLA